MIQKNFYPNNFNGTNTIKVKKIKAKFLLMHRVYKLIIKNNYNIFSFFLFFYPNFFNQKSLGNEFANKLNKNDDSLKAREFKKSFISKNIWKKINPNHSQPLEIQWKKIQENKELIFEDKSSQKLNKLGVTSINSLNRSILFNSETIGPDISWLVPNGFKWSQRYNLDLSTRGYSRRKTGQSFIGWNGGDAVGEIHYQPLHIGNYSLGVNFGIRSVYSGSAPGGASAIGEGVSSGFRIDRRISETAGLAFGGEQILHFDNKTDTGRNIYFVASKAWLSDTYNNFPIVAATAGVGTGKLAEGNIKGLCSNLLGGSGTEEAHLRSLCWSPIFSLAKIFNHNFSTFFEYNSKWFLVGSSYSPSKNIPLRGTFAVIISDHIDNYKLHDFNELRYVFRLSLGF